MARGSRTNSRDPRCIPVHPARRGTTISGRSPGSRIKARRPPSRWPCLYGTSGAMDGALPGHSCGGSFGMKPNSLLGPLARTTRDVAVPLAPRRKCRKSLHCMLAPTRPALAPASTRAPVAGRIRKRGGNHTPSPGLRAFGLFRPQPTTADKTNGTSPIMTIRFAAARNDHQPIIYRIMSTATVRRAANDNHNADNDTLIGEALRHFATHGLAAASAARNHAMDAIVSGDDEKYDRWLRVCRMLDRRMAARLEESIASKSA